MRTDIFCENDKVLLVGEGNFSFAVDLVKHNLNIKITATCYESSIVFDSGIKNADYLNKLGVQVMLGVDATKLYQHFYKDYEKFDKIIFNFPHVGGKMKINRNRELLKNFFISCNNIINTNGIILISLCNGQGGTPADIPQRRWDDSWQIVENAAHGNFLLTKIEPFSFNNFTGYSCVGYRSLEKGFDNKNSIVHYFEKSEEPNIDNIALNNDFNELLFNFNENLEWKEFVSKLSENMNRHNGELKISSIYPLSFKFDVTFTVCEDFLGIEFYKILYKFAGNVVEDVEFLGAYKFSKLNKITRTYRIFYKSYSLPLHRDRVINLHKNLITKIIEDNLNVVVTK